MASRLQGQQREMGLRRRVPGPRGVRRGPRTRWSAEVQTEEDDCAGISGDIWVDRRAREVGPIAYYASLGQ